MNGRSRALDMAANRLRGRILGRVPRGLEDRKQSIEDNGFHKMKVKPDLEREKAILLASVAGKGHEYNVFPRGVRLRILRATS